MAEYPVDDASPDPAPHVVLRLADVGVHLVADGARVRMTTGAEPVIADLSNPEAAALVAGLAETKGLAEADIVGSRDAARIYLALERIRARADVVWELHGSHGPLARAASIAPDFELGPELEPGTEGGALDPAVHLRRAHDLGVEFPVIVSAPGLSCEVRLSPAGARIVAGLLAGEPDPLMEKTADEAAVLRAFLVRCGMGAGPGGADPWAFHDRVMHGATRPPDDSRSIAVVPGMGGPSLPEIEWMRADPHEFPTAIPQALPRPDPSDMFVRRRSLRDFAATPPDADSVRSLLSRSLAFQAIRGLGAARWVERAFPAAGGLGEIIGYVAVRDVYGLDMGLYRHDPLMDRMEWVGRDDQAFSRLFEGAASAMLRPGRPPPMVLILAARIDLLAAKYGALGYRLALLNVGAAASVVQLAAEDLGFGCCGLGTAAIRELPTLAGTELAEAFANGHREVSVFEIAVGVRPRGGAT